jgi:hypothetical protein
LPFLRGGLTKPFYYVILDFNSSNFSTFYILTNSRTEVFFNQMKAIMGLIIAAIGVYIGVGLIPGINSTVAGITTAAGYGSGVVGMVSVVD